MFGIFRDGVISAFGDLWSDGTEDTCAFLKSFSHGRGVALSLKMLH